MLDILYDVFSNYSLNIAIVHIISAIVLFFIVNWIGAHSISIGYIQLSIMAKEDTAPAFNFIFRILSPIVYYVLFIVVVQSLEHPEFVRFSYLIILYYWIFRTIVIILFGRNKLTNWGLHIVYWIISISISIWIYLLVEKVDKLLPDPRSLLDQMWILIIIFLFSVLNNIELSHKGTIKRRKSYINHQYTKFKSEFGSLISEKCSNEFYEAATYSIMIYENFNRPKIIRMLEYLRFYITKKPHTLGIMQVNTDKYIDDKMSIVKAIVIIVSATIKHKRDIKNYSYDSLDYAICDIAGTYNCDNEDYKSEISEVFDIIKANYNNIEKDYNEIEI